MRLRAQGRPITPIELLQQPPKIKHLPRELGKRVSRGERTQPRRPSPSLPNGDADVTCTTLITASKKLYNTAALLLGRRETRPPPASSSTYRRQSERLRTPPWTYTHTYIYAQTLHTVPVTGNLTGLSNTLPIVLQQASNILPMIVPYYRSQAAAVPLTGH